MKLQNKPSVFATIFISILLTISLATSIKAQTEQAQQATQPVVVASIEPKTASVQPSPASETSPVNSVVDPSKQSPLLYSDDLITNAKAITLIEKRFIPMLTPKGKILTRLVNPIAWQYIENAAKATGIDAERLGAHCHTESRFNYNGLDSGGARSNRAAAGPFQFIRKTGRVYGLKQHYVSRTVVVKVLVYPKRKGRGRRRTRGKPIIKLMKRTRRVLVKDDRFDGQKAALSAARLLSANDLEYGGSAEFGSWVYHSGGRAKTALESFLDEVYPNWRIVCNNSLSEAIKRYHLRYADVFFVDSIKAPKTAKLMRQLDTARYDWSSTYLFQIEASKLILAKGGYAKTAAGRLNSTVTSEVKPAVATSAKVVPTAAIFPIPPTASEHQQAVKGCVAFLSQRLKLDVVAAAVPVDPPALASSLTFAISRQKLNCSDEFQLESVLQAFQSASRITWRKQDKAFVIRITDDPAVLNSFINNLPR